MSKLVGARVYNNADETINDSTLTVVTFNTEDFDTDSIHSTVTNTGRLTCNTAGYYMITGVLKWSGSDKDGDKIAIIRVNGTTNIAASRDKHDASGTYYHSVITTIYQLAATDYVELVAYQTSGSNIAVLYEAGISPHFMMHRIG